MKKAKKGLLSVLGFAVSAVAALGAVWTVGAKDVDPIEASAAAVAWDSWDGTAANGFAYGSGTASSPYVIETAEQLAYLAQSVNGGNSSSGKYISLESDIDLCNIEWTPIGTGENYSETRHFCGYFQGNNFAISNMTISNAENAAVGLFGVVEGGSLSNFSILNYVISGAFTDCEYYAIGAVAGWLASNMSNVYATGSIDLEMISNSDNHTRIGGLIGQIWDPNDVTTVITNSYAVCDIQVTSLGVQKIDVGGFVGMLNGGAIRKCYANANVQGNASNVHVGAFAGLMEV